MSACYLFMLYIVCCMLYLAEGPFWGSTVSSNVPTEAQIRCKLHITSPRNPYFCKMTRKCYNGKCFSYSFPSSLFPPHCSISDLGSRISNLEPPAPTLLLLLTSKFRQYTVLSMLTMLTRLDHKISLRTPIRTSPQYRGRTRKSLHRHRNQFKLSLAKICCDLLSHPLYSGSMYAMIVTKDCKQVSKLKLHGMFQSEWPWRYRWIFMLAYPSLLSVRIRMIRNKFKYEGFRSWQKLRFSLTEREVGLLKQINI